MLQTELLKVVQYLRQHQGLKALIEEAISRYRSLERVGGTIMLEVATEQEARALAGLLKRRIKPPTRLNIAMTELDKIFADLLPNAPLTLFEVMEAYAGEQLETNKMRQARLAAEKAAFFNDLALGSAPVGKAWLQAIAAAPAKFRKEHTCYKVMGPSAKQSFKAVLTVLDSCPYEKLMRLPILAQQVTGDPHYFDIDKQEGRMLLNALSWLNSTPDDFNGSNPEWEAEILFAGGIVRDDISNAVTVAGIYGIDGEREATWLRLAAEECAAPSLSLRDIVRWPQFKPLSGDRVYVVENPSVFSTLLETYSELYGTAPPLICSSGQFRLAVWQLLSRLTASGTIVYYSGDFDPEGIMMADRLWERFQDSTRLWRFSMEDYQSAVHVEVISEERLKQLEAIKASALMDVAASMKESKRAAFQEGIIDKLTSDLCKGSGT